MNYFRISFAGLLLAVFSNVNASEPYPRRSDGMFQDWDGLRLDLVSRFIPAAAVIFEAGGHYGEDSVKLSEKWPEGRVFTFEPNPPAFDKLLAATKAYPNITAQNLAVNDYNGTATLHVCYGTNGDDPVFEGASSLLEASDSMKIHYGGPKVEVPCVILDDWCQENGVSHIDFMWLDLEGLELQILRSSPKILATVKVIYTETNFYPFRIGTTAFPELRSFLEGSGFQLVGHWYNEGLQGDAIFVRRELVARGIR